MGKSKSKRESKKPKRGKGGGPVSAAGSLKNKGGRPRKEIDMKTLEGLCRIQCTEVECAAVLQVDIDTMNARLVEAGEISFSEFYKKHSEGGKASLRRAQWAAAIGERGKPGVKDRPPNITMLIWLGKQVLGQKDHIEHDGNMNVTAQLSMAALKKSAEAYNKATAEE